MTTVSEASQRGDGLLRPPAHCEEESPPDATRADARFSGRADRTADRLVGRLINDRYRILSTIAQGGMGKVYRAEQASLGRLVALKVLRPGYGGDNDPDFHKRFFLEASIASKLKHPNTVTIFDYGRTEDDIFYIAMELLEGRTLQHLLRDEGPLDAERMIHIAAQICCALREAHGLGVVHRDLKPANVYIVKHGDEREFAKVLDFGLVKDTRERSDQLTQTGMFLGSPRYMSPEQIQAGTIDPRVDIYALGVMMYEMLTGKVPFDSANTVEILMAHVNAPVPPMRVQHSLAPVPPALEKLVRRCMAKSPYDRLTSMQDLLSALTQYTAASARAPGEAHSVRPRTSSIEHADPASTKPAMLGARQGQSVPLFTQATKPLGSAAPLLLAAGFILVSIGTLLALSSPQEKDMASGTPHPPAAAREAAVMRNETGETNSEQGSVLISLRSSPPGAMVVVGDREYGPTPVEIEWTGPDALPGRQVTFRFRRTGYRAVLVSRKIHGERLEVTAAFQDPLQHSLASPHPK